MIRQIYRREIWLRLSFHLTQKTLWAPVGHEVAFEQIQLAGGKPAAKIDTTLLPDVTIIEQNDTVRIQGVNFTVVFSRSEGTLISLVYDGKEISGSEHSGPLPAQFCRSYRAITSNDKAFGKGRARDWKQAGLDQLTRNSQEFPNKPYCETIKFRLDILSTSTTPNDAGFNLQTTWTVRGDGSLDMANRFEPFGTLPPLPRLGVVMHIANEYNFLALVWTRTA